MPVDFSDVDLYLIAAYLFATSVVGTGLIAIKGSSPADVILAKGQGNYESLCTQGRRIFYAFLCKCDLFTDRFGVPRFTGMFLEES